MATTVGSVWTIRLASSWLALAAWVQASLVELDLVDAVGFRGLMNGTPESAIALAQELGGSAEDGPYLHRIWL